MGGDVPYFNISQNTWGNIDQYHKFYCLYIFLELQNFLKVFYV